MKKKIALKLMIPLLSLLLITSCMKLSDDQKPATKESELANLKTYLQNLATAGHNIDTTALGVYYVTREKGEGAFAKTGDTLTVGYAGYLVNGYMFDSSTLTNPEGKWTFILGNPPMIKGWDDAMKQMNKNAKMEFIVPSDLAYGSAGQGIIGPYQTLVFVIKMFEIKPSK